MKPRLQTSAATKYSPTCLVNWFARPEVIVHLRPLTSWMIDRVETNAPQVRRHLVSSRCSYAVDALRLDSHPARHLISLWPPLQPLGRFRDFGLLQTHRGRIPSHRRALRPHTFPTQPRIPGNWPRSRNRLIRPKSTNQPICSDRLCKVTRVGNRPKCTFPPLGTPTR